MSAGRRQRLRGGPSPWTVAVAWLTEAPGASWFTMTSRCSPEVVLLARFDRAQVPALLDAPLVVVQLDEAAHRGPQLLDSAVGPSVDDLLLQRAVEALHHAVGFGLLDEGEARVDAPELDLVEKVLGEVLGAVIHAQRQPAGDSRPPRRRTAG